MVRKSCVLENNSGNISETRNDRGKFTIGTHQCCFERYHPRPLWPPFPQDWGFATPTQNSNLKSRENECTEINSLYGIGVGFFGGGVGVESVGIARDRTNLSRERVKLRTLNFVHTFTRSITTKAHEKNGKSSCGHSQEVSKIFRVPIYGVHCAVIFAIAQLSCYLRFYIYNFILGLYHKPSNRSPFCPWLLLKTRLVLETRLL